MVGFYERLIGPRIGEIYSYQELDGETELYRMTKITINSKFMLLKVTADLLDKQFQPKIRGIILPPEILEELVLIDNLPKSNKT